MLSNESIRDFLCKAFFGDKEEYNKYIVPLQGNWYNPVDDGGQAATWIGFHVVSITARARPFIQDDEVRVNADCLLHLQFIGPQGFEFAQTILNWNMREDIKKLLHDKWNAWLYADSRRIKSTQYNQDGQNNTLAYGIEVKFNYMPSEKPGMPIYKGIELSGNIIIGGKNV